MVLTRLLLCLGIAFCAAQDASCEHTSLIQDHASHAGQRLKTEAGERSSWADFRPLRFAQFASLDFHCCLQPSHLTWIR